MGWIEENMKSTQIRQILYQAISLGMIIASALMIWKGLICITGTESPIVVVLTGSMEPGFKRGDILFLYMNKDPVRAGEIVVFNDGRDIPIVHRVIEVHERQGTKEADILTKGDANDMDDRILYTSSQRWLRQKYIMGRAVGFLPYVGWVTIIMTDKPIIKSSHGWFHFDNHCLILQIITNNNQGNFNWITIQIHAVSLYRLLQNDSPEGSDHML